VIPEDDVTAPVYAELRRKTLFMLSGLGLSVLIVLLTAITITRPISRLAKGVREVASGDLEVQVADTGSRDEIGDFARAFNRMVRDLKTHVAALTRETAAREAVESELRIARTIQASLLPRTFPPFPHRKEFELFAVNVPAKEVAGDFFDFYFLSDDQLLITIADLSDKGVPAALFMAVTRTLLKNLTTSGSGPAEALVRANDILAEDNDESMFVTLFLALYDTTTGRLQFANAGHNPPYLVRAQGRVESPDVMKATGLVLGVMEGQEYGEEEVDINVGDALVLYTDGVTEACPASGELYGEDRFEELLAQHASEKPERLCEIVVEDLDRHQRGNQYNDVTILILQRKA